MDSIIAKFISDNITVSEGKRLMNKDVMDAWVATTGETTGRNKLYAAIYALHGVYKGQGFFTNVEFTPKEVKTVQEAKDVQVQAPGLTAFEQAQLEIQRAALESKERARRSKMEAEAKFAAEKAAAKAAKADAEAKLAREKMEAEKIKAEAEAKLAREKIAAEKIKAEAEAKLAREKIAAEKIKAEAEAKIAREKIAAEKIKAEAEKIKAEAEAKIAREKIAAEKIKAEAEAKIAREKIAADVKIAAEKAAAKAAKAEAEAKLAREKAAAKAAKAEMDAKLAREKIESDKSIAAESNATKLRMVELKVNAAKHLMEMKLAEGERNREFQRIENNKSRALYAVSSYNRHLDPEVVGTVSKQYVTSDSLRRCIEFNAWDWTGEHNKLAMGSLKNTISSMEEKIEIVMDGKSVEKNVIALETAIDLTSKVDVGVIPAKVVDEGLKLVSEIRVDDVSKPVVEESTAIAVAEIAGSQSMLLKRLVEVPKIASRDEDRHMKKEVDWMVVDQSAKKDKAKKLDKRRYIRSKQSASFGGNGQIFVKCDCCGVSMDLDDGGCHRGHNLPDSRGGSWDKSNIRLICASCNLNMSDKYTIREYKIKVLYIPITHDASDASEVVSDDSEASCDDASEASCDDASEASCGDASEASCGDEC